MYKSSADELRDRRQAEGLGKKLVEDFRQHADNCRQEYCATCIGPMDNLQLTLPGMPAPVVRTFETGANRDVDNGKLDYEGFLSPLVLERYAEYMHKNRYLRDGSIRDSDNWQKGIPLSVYVKSLWRHFFGVWKGYRQGTPIVEDLCGVLFNTMGMLHELLKVKP